MRMWHRAIFQRAAENFEIDRRIVFYNGVTGDYMLTIEGRCAIEDQKTQLEVTCQTGPRDYRKHFLGLSDNVTYFAEQLSQGDVSAYHYRITFKPQVIVPDFDFRGSSECADGQHIRGDAIDSTHAMNLRLHIDP